MLSLRKIIFITAIISTTGGLAQIPVSSADQVHVPPAGLMIYPPAELASPTGTAILYLSGKNTGTEKDILIESLNKKGVTVFQTDHNEGPVNLDEIQPDLEYIQGNKDRYNLLFSRIGLIVKDCESVYYTESLSVSFLGIINSTSQSKLKSLEPIPLFLSLEKENSREVMKVYKKEGNAEIHIHPSAVNDSIYTAEVLGWLAGQGYLTPLSTEKTEAQKKHEDWNNLMKFYDNLLHTDWPLLSRFEADNARLQNAAPEEKRVVFMGNSITEGWINDNPAFFQQNGYINRGIGGQTTPQMLVRFREDVINLHPEAVVILAGINDIAENTGPSKIENVAGNIFSMAELAKAHGIKVILCSVLPARSFPWHPGIDPVEPVIRLNKMLKDYAEANDLGFVDYYSVMVDDQHELKKELCTDGVHPNPEGYRVMEPLVKSILDKTLSVR